MRWNKNVNIEGAIIKGDRKLMTIQVVVHMNGGMGLNVEIHVTT